MRHIDKVKMAKAMLTREEARSGTPIFQSKAWKKRKKHIAQKQLLQQGKRFTVWSIMRSFKARSSLG